MLLSTPLLRSEPGSGDIVSHKVGDEDFCRIAAPHLIEQARLEAADLKSATLLLETTRPDIWNKWFHATNGIVTTRTSASIHFNHFDMVISAAINRPGVGLARAC